MRKKVVLEIPDSMFDEIIKFKEESHLPDEQSAICELIRYALTLPPYFRDFDWEKAETEADSDIASGRVEEFSSVDEFLSDLNA
ncbi:MAG: hypothetical protein QMC83_04275 [Thermodesulfovibrionales bacterium]|nr:hypothetical protein [Thermodesulfovibrionales bacterium]